jgi:hypothetical protein
MSEFKFPDEVESKPFRNEEEKIEIEIEDDTPEEDRGRKPMATPVEEVTDEELDSYDEKVQKRIKRFTKGYHDERRAKEEALREREAAEQFAMQVYEENKRLQAQLSEGGKILAEQSKTSAQRALDMAKDSYRKAYESADTEAVIAAQEAIARATVEVEKVKNLKTLSVRMPNEEISMQQAPQQKPKLQPETEKWLHKNQDWFMKDDEMTSLAMGLDKKLAKEYGQGYIGTPEYFETIDKTMRKRFPEYFQSDTEPDEESPRRATTRPANVVAPATRSTPPGRIRLKASEANIAKRLGVPLELYAKQVALLKDGR